MNFANILKILPGTLKLGEVAAIAANNGYQSQTSQVLGAASQAVGVASSVVPGSGTANADVPNTPATAGPTPQTQFKPDMQGMTGAQKQELTKAVNQQNAWLKQQQAPKADLLKVKPEVKPGGYTKESGLQESYLDGLKLSGAKLDNKGQIVKQSGQAFKKPGWDRKAQLMGGRRTPDRLHRLRMLAIDKASVSATDVKASPNTMNISEPQTPRQDKLKPGAIVPIEVKEFNPTPEPPAKPSGSVVGTDKSGEPKTAAEITREFQEAQNSPSDKPSDTSKLKLKQVPEGHWSGMGGLWIDKDWNWDNDGKPRAWTRPDPNKKGLW